MAHSLNRRDFVKSTIAGFATAITAEDGKADVTPGGATKLILENDQMAWEFSRQGSKIASTGLRNKLSGRYFSLAAASELRLTFSAAKSRIEIPWWRCTFGPDRDTTSQEGEQGYKQGYHQKGFDDSKWSSCLNLGLRGLSSAAGLSLHQGRPPVVYQGYGWFRAGFRLPASAQGEEIVLNLGGYDPTDWKEYWIYVNGVQVGRRSTSGPWRVPGQFRVSPQSAAYGTLRFGSAEDNVIAVRTYSYDRQFGGLSENVLDRHIFDPVLHDQLAAVGDPYLQVSDFEVTAVHKEGTASRPALTVELVNRDAKLRATLHYELEGPIRRKWVDVRNEGTDRRLLLDVDLDTFQVDASFADGGYGYPLTIDDQVFAAIEHPSGLSRWNEKTMQMTHFPGKGLMPGETWRSHPAIVGVAAPREANRQFLDYLEAHAVRKKKILALYDPFGITAFTEGMSWALDDYQNMGTLDLLAKWQKRGIKFDYYIPDMSLDTTSDLKKFRLFSFPDGPGEMIQRIQGLGMKFGQWFCVTAGAWSNWRNPKTAPSRVPSPKESPHALFRNGYLADISGGVGNLCVASEPHFSMLRDAVVHHIKENHVELIKLDGGDYYCNSTEHEHLPGKYSTEACFSHLVEIARAARNANPDVFVVWYWGAYSPFLALHGDVIFDIRLSMEAASTGDYPALFFRDAVTQALDQGAQYARWVPPMNHDSLGVWLANNWWGNQMETVRWQEALIMDLARGNLLFPQIWSDLYNLEDGDVDFLARMQGFVKRNERVFWTRRRTIGDAWKDEIYGFSYFDGTHGFVFLNNVSFQSRKIRLELGEPIGLDRSKGQPVRLRLHHPVQAALARSGNPEFRVGEAVEIQVRPFEVLMVEVQPEGSAESGLPTRETVETSPLYSFHVPVNKAARMEDLEIHFADAAQLEGRGFKKGFSAFQAKLPEYTGARHHVAIVNTFRKDGRWWRQSQMSEVVQAIATVGDAVVEFTRTPEYRQISNNQWNPWIVFSAPLPRSFSGQDIRFGITSHLPPGVEMATDLWVIREWWPRRTRSLPNYWV